MKMYSNYMGFKGPCFDDLLLNEFFVNHKDTRFVTSRLRTLFEDLLLLNNNKDTTSTPLLCTSVVH